MKGPPPTPPGLPIVGHAHRWARDPFTIGSWANEAVGGVARIELFGEEMVLVTDPGPIEEVLIDKRDAMRKSDQYDVAFGEGLGSVSGQQWRRQRDVISRFFRPERIESAADAMVSLAGSQSEAWPDGAEIRLYDEMKALTLQILFETVFDYPIDPRGADSDILTAIDDLDEWFRPTSWVLPKWVPTPARRRFDRATSRVDAIAADLLADPDAGEDGLLAMLQELDRREETSLTDTEVRSQLRTFLFAGHETTASAISLALHLLSTHDDVESRFHDEVDSVLDGRDPGIADLGALAVTDNVVRETLRLYPPAFRLPRVAARNVKIGGCAIEAGTDVLVSVVTPQRDERFWDAPGEFWPSRWRDLDPDATGFEYLPFSAGPRSCIGERFALTEMRLLLAALGGTFSFEPRSDVEIAARVSATPKGPLPATVERR